MGNRFLEQRFPKWMWQHGYCKAICGGLPKWIRTLHHRTNRRRVKTSMRRGDDPIREVPKGKFPNTYY